MAFSEQSRSESLVRPVTVRPVESVDSAATVRHVDQREPDDLEDFLALVAGDRAVAAAETPLEEGDVIVFTDYYRVASV